MFAIVDRHADNQRWGPDSDMRHGTVAAYDAVTVKNPRCTASKASKDAYIAEGLPHLSQGDCARQGGGHAAEDGEAEG